MKKIIFVWLLSLAVWSCQTDRNNTHTASSADERFVDSLIKVMTLEEKIGQMTQICFSNITLDGSKALNLDAEKFKEVILKYHVGSFLSGSDSAHKWVNFIEKLQKIAVEETRLGIPLLIGIDHVHGANYVLEGTILPHNLTLSCSFDTSLAAQAARITAIETADLGLIWNFAPVLDVGKNAYWPRLYETFGEDPLLCGLMGSTFIRHYENCPEVAPYQLSACAKHFIGYSDPKSGWDRTPAEIPHQVLYEQFVPPFKMAFQAGVKTLMVNSGELNGEPVHGSQYYLDKMLRKKLGFQGVILTDIKDIMKMVEMHGAFANEKDATLAAIRAGIDMSMACNSYEFTRIMKELVQEGKITEARINESVKRILLLKKQLGLFENPYPSKARLHQIGSEAHRQAAIKAAEESIVLMKNDGLLPLPDGKKIFLAGFAADSKKMLNGAWTFEWMGAEENKQPARMHTIYTALKEKMPNSKIILADSATCYNSAKLAQTAQQADVVVLTIGETPYSEFKGNTNDISISAEQQAQIKAIQATGKPLILIILAGRPVVLTPFLEKTNAILFAGSPGVGGGDAIAGILNGTVNPSAKLSFTYPDAVGHIVPYYVKQSEYHHDRTGKFTPRFPFGWGLSYTTYEYAHLTLSDTLITDLNQTITATVQVTNQGKIDGKEAVLWFLQDEVGIITRPVKQLKGVEKKFIKAGETQTFSFIIQPQEMFAYPDHEGNPIVEDGYFKLMVGNLSARIKLDRTTAKAK